MAAIQEIEIMNHNDLRVVRMDTTAALGHVYKTVVTAPTCTEGGYTTYTCACGSSYVSDKTSAHGHSYTAVETNNAIIYTCDDCGDSYTETLAVEYSYDKVSSFKSGESYVITLYSNRKYYALSHKNNQLTAVAVTVSQNKITSEISDDLLWTYSSDKSLSYTSNNTKYYLNASSSGGFNSTKTLAISTSAKASVSISSNRLKVGSSYLRYSSGKISLNSSATTAYLFQQNEK